MLGRFYHLVQHVKNMGGVADQVRNSSVRQSRVRVPVTCYRLFLAKRRHGCCAEWSRLFQGVRLQVLTLRGIPVEIVLVLVRENGRFSQSYSAAGAPQLRLHDPRERSHPVLTVPCYPDVFLFQ